MIQTMHIFRNVRIETQMATFCSFGLANSVSFMAWVGSQDSRAKHFVGHDQTEPQAVDTLGRRDLGHDPLASCVVALVDPGCDLRGDPEGSLPPHPVNAPCW